MATKTLSIDEEAYLCLVRAKRDRRDSFSKVIKRASWNDGPRRCGDLLARVAGYVPDRILDKLEAAQNADAPPADRWNR